MCSCDMKKNRVQDVTAVVQSNERLNEYYYLLSLKVPEIASRIRPGQFVHVLLPDADCLLRRPFSIFNVQEGDAVQILYKVVGRGTRMLSGIRQGSALSVLGPLGNGYDMPDRNASVVLIGGGTGIASLNFLYERLRSAGHTKVVFAVGFLNKDCVLASYRTGVAVFTDDGSFGMKGFVTDILKTVDPHSTVYVCGPHAMMDKVRGWARTVSAPSVFVSLEERMACGIGACLGCVVETRDGRKTACKDGPIFSADVLI